MENRSANLLIDGEYKSEITLEGGTGRTTIQSPANVYIENGVVTAEIIWSSPNYDLMIIGDKEYKSISNDGHSLFLVEIPSLDTPLEIKAETVAMSTPHLIDYTITVSGAEILKSESSSESLPLTSEDLASMLDSILALDPVSGSDQLVYSATAVSPETSGGVPAIVMIGVGAALGAAVAFVAVTLGKNKKK